MRGYLGHSKNDNGNGVTETLNDHVRNVVRTASNFASAFDAEQSAAAAAWFHDLGKFADQMQLRLQGKDPIGRDHWSAGVIATWTLYGKLGPTVFNPIAASIAGHHVGLESYWPRPKATIEGICKQMLKSPEEFTSNDVGDLLKRHETYGFPTPALEKPFVADESWIGSMIDTRMLFSTLVDADFLETEAHFEGDAAVLRRYRANLPRLDFQAALKRLTSYVSALPNNADKEINRMRADLFSQCLSAGRTITPGIYTLSAPTGAGKTFSMLALALAAASNPENDLSRIVLSMPFLNIIDQTAIEYSELFSTQHGFDPSCILEDHSTAELRTDQGGKSDGNDPRDSWERTRRLAAENWDASVVLTTNVKLLESLQANRPARCRKLHRLANSVILFDEVQTIPPKLIKPTLATLAYLAHRYKSVIVFATATQPAFEHLNDGVKTFSGYEWAPSAIVKGNQWMYDIASSRVSVRWELDNPRTWESIATEMAEPDSKQSVCIVNLKRHAQGLVDLLKNNDCEGVTHLSTNMCGAHRQLVLKKVSEALRIDSKKPLRLVSTQCIEAGVNLDTPVMFRALAPLEAIAQAAGRCNRHGRRVTPGRVTVLKPESDERPMYPGGAYTKAANATEIFLRQHSSFLQGNVLNNPELMAKYYRDFYSLDESVTTHKDLFQAVQAGDFRETAKLYRLIEGDQINILVPYKKSTFNRLKEMLNSEHRPPRFVTSWIREARQFSVSIHRPDRNHVLWNYLDPVQFSRAKHLDIDEADWFILLNEDLYDETLGLKTELEFDGVNYY